MSSDIVEKLRRQADCALDECKLEYNSVMEEAADEIARLRAALASAEFRVWNEAIEAAQNACSQQQTVFLSDKYSVNQPIASIGERFACGACSARIGTLKKEQP